MIPGSTRIAKLLRLYRNVNDIGVRDLAPEIGISIATLSRVERGHQMDLATWLKIQDWLLR